MTRRRILALAATAALAVLVTTLVLGFFEWLHEDDVPTEERP